MMKNIAADRLCELVTIVVAPRERHYSIIPSLVSLFATIPPGLRVIVAQGDIPADLRPGLAELRSLRPFDLIETPYPLYPQEARNLCIDAATSEYVVMADNDIEYEAGWLEALVGNALENEAQIVAPLIFIGPPRVKTIHHAGGRIRITPLAEGGLGAVEDHMFSNKDIADVDPATLGIANQTVEFHCFLASRSYLVDSGGLDERMTTQEQIHFGLLARHLGAKVTFEAGARVTYVAKKVFTPEDLQYLSFRWNDAQARDSMHAINAMWGLSLDVPKLVAKWIRPHRARAYGTLHSEQLKALSLQDFYNIVMVPLEAAAIERAMKLREGRTLRTTDPVNAATRVKTLDQFLETPVAA